MANGMIHGREYKFSDAKEGVKPRVIVDGVNHGGGSPIRFKSLDRADRHILNMRLQKKDT